MDHIDRQKRIEERLQRLSETRRTQLLKEPLFSKVADRLEESKTPTLVFRDHRLAYANPEALKKMEYSYRQLDTFNSMELDTGPSKKRLDEILAFSAKAGLGDLEFNFTMPTLDRKLLYMTPQLHRFVAEGAEYWITELKDITKVDPASASGKVYSWLQRMFRRQVTVRDAPEYVNERFAKELLTAMIDKSSNVLVTLDNTRKIESPAIQLLGHYTTEPVFSDQIFLTTKHPEIGHWMRYKGVAKDNVYVPSELPKDLQPALVAV
jgi:hypothetical protein